jgi:HSP20 family protein
MKRCFKMPDIIPHNDDRRPGKWTWNLMAPWYGNLWNDDMIEGFWGNAPGLGRSPRSDVREDEKEYIVEAELPGFERNQISIDWDDNVLTISAKKSNAVNDETHSYIRRERACGEYRRSFMLENVSEEGITAQYNDGILKVILPKMDRKMTKGKKIDIQ